MKAMVLLVDDDLDILEFYRCLISTIDGVVVRTAITGEEALEKYTSMPVPPDIIILDHRLPGCSGAEVAANILKNDPNAAIIYVSADQDGIRTARLLGIERVHQKPADVFNLINDIEQLLVTPSNSKHCPQSN